MANTVTIIYGSGGRSGFIADAPPMYDSDEGILVVEQVYPKATAYFNVKDYVLAWVVSEDIDPDELHATIQSIKDEEAKEAEEEERRAREQREKGFSGGIFG